MNWTAVIITAIICGSLLAICWMGMEKGGKEE